VSVFCGSLSSKSSPSRTVFPCAVQSSRPVRKQRFSYTLHYTAILTRLASPPFLGLHPAVQCGIQRASSAGWCGAHVLIPDHKVSAVAGTNVLKHLEPRAVANLAKMYTLKTWVCVAKVQNTLLAEVARAEEGIQFYRERERERERERVGTHSKSQTLQGAHRHWLTRSLTYALTHTLTERYSYAHAHHSLARVPIFRVETCGHNRWTSRSSESDTSSPQF
jgi:hypothetical protein